MFTGYMVMSGVELVNHNRFASYMRAGMGGGVSLFERNLECPTLVFDDPGPYSLPHLDPAPWYSASRPESAHFAGLMIESVIGLDSPYEEREYAPAILGGALGGLRLKGKQFLVTATLYGLSNLGLEYGLAWLTSVLSGQNAGSTTVCNLGDLEFFVGCPDPARGGCAGVPTVDETALDLRRTMYSVGLISGPRVTNRHNRDGQVVAYQVTFVVASESPYMAGTPVLVSTAALDVAAATAAESWTCPEYVDPCADAEGPSGLRQSCITFVEDTCDWNDGLYPGPSSWATQTWTATGEEVIGTSPGLPCNTVLSRTGNAAIDGCIRPSVRCSFGDAVGGNGPISIEFDYTAGQGNVYFHLWNPATNTNIPISSFTKPSGAAASTDTAPTGAVYHLYNGTTDLGHHVINYNLPTGVDPGSLYLILSAFGGGSVAEPQTETVRNIVMNFTGTAAAYCCTLEPGQPVLASTFDIPCWADPTQLHRTVASVANPSLVDEHALRFTITNTDVATTVQNLRVAIYDPTLIGLAASAVPTAAGVWPSGVAEWECNALVADFYLPEIPAATVLEIDGARRQSLRWPVGSPDEARSGARYIYGGETSPWNYRPIPPGKTWAVVVFADEGATPSGTTLLVQRLPLFITDGAAA